jgi:hypothetical protein
MDSWQWVTILKHFHFSVLQGLQLGCGCLRVLFQISGHAGAVHQLAVDAAPKPLSLFCSHELAKLFILARV